MSLSIIRTGFLPALLFLVLACAVPDAPAQDFSSRHHRFRVTVVADGLAKRYGQVAVVDNAPGAAGPRFPAPIVSVPARPGAETCR